MISSERPGIAFQNLVATLERVLSGREGVEIASPKYLPDKDTGAMREHDIVITWNDGHHVKLTAIECKDTGRKVGAPQIEGFAKKCERTGIHHAVIVSSNGFAKTAAAKAAAFGVDLMRLSEVERFDWMAADFVVGFHRQFSPVDVQVTCVDEMPEGKFKIIDSEGVEIPVQQFINQMQQNLEEPDDMNLLVDKIVPVSLKILTPNLYAEHETGKRLKVQFVGLLGSYTVHKRKHVVRSHSYKGDNADYSVVSTDLALGDMDGKLVFVRYEDGIRVVWQPTA